MQSPRETTEYHLSSFIEMTPDLVCIAGRDGFFKKVNRAVIEKFGYTERELMTKPIDFFMHPEDRQLTLHKRVELFEGKSLVNFRNRYIARNGSIIWLEWTSLYFPKDEVVFAIAKDITKRKQMEQEIEDDYRKFKNLASQFKTRIEEDRKFLARELHEELAQLAAVLRADIDGIKRYNEELPPAIVSRVNNAGMVSQQLIAMIRRLSFYISPNMLDHLGLNATLAWYCREVSILSGVSYNYDSSFKDGNLTDEIRIDVFRICQEALNNVMHHSGATEVKVSLEEITDGRIRLTVADNGKGFDPARLKPQPGLTRMRERATSINAELAIQSRPGGGTTVSAIINPS
jgi:PAS domain S-box-containing protein